MSAVTRLFSFSANSTVDASAVFFKCHPRHLESHTTLAVRVSPSTHWLESMPAFLVIAYLLYPLQSGDGPRDRTHWPGHSGLAGAQQIPTLTRHFLRHLLWPGCTEHGCGTARLILIYTVFFRWTPDSLLTGEFEEEIITFVLGLTF
jgi:hypothetical protein